MVLQRYRAKQELGKGSFGTVYLTEGRRDKKPYVVKVVDNLRENNLKVQEIRVMMHLKHRNIVEMCDFYTSNNQLCIVMEYADGGDLRHEVIKARNGKTTISEELVSVWLIQVCQALDYAHEEQIIHRDIKPSNIFLMADGKTVKIGDFGISKVLDAASGANQMTASEADGGRVGTKRYMAPEILNRKDYSNKADIWSLGCVLFELLTLNHPTYEQDRRIWFEWIPAIYSSNIREVCQQCLLENALLRPSPKDLIVKLAGPYLSAPLVQAEFYQTIQWYDSRLSENRALFEHHAELIRQIFPNYHVPVPAPFLQAGEGTSGGAGVTASGPASVGSESSRTQDKGIAQNASANSTLANRGNLYSSHGGNQPKPEAPLSDSKVDLRKSQPGVQKENLPPLRASMSSIEHFNIPEYTEDEPDNKTKLAEFTALQSSLATLRKEEHKSQRSAAPLPNGEALKASSQVQDSQAAVQPLAIPEQQVADQGLWPPTEPFGTHAMHMRNGNERSNGVSIPPWSNETPVGAGRGDQPQIDNYQQPSIDNYQRQQELAMMANFGPQQRTHTYGMQTVPQIYSSAPASSSYPQPHQPYDLYSSQNSMPQYALQPQPGSAGPHVQQQVPQSYNQQQMNSYPQQGMHNMQQAIRSGGPYDLRNQYPASASGYVDTRQSAPALPNPNTFGVQSGYDQASLSQQNTSMGLRNSFDQQLNPNSNGLRGSFEQSNLLHQRSNLRASFNQSSQQPTNQTTSMQQQQDIRASFDQFRLQQQQQPQQQQNLRASFDSAGTPSRYAAGLNGAPPSVSTAPMQQQQQPSFTPSTRASYDQVTLNRIHQQEMGASFPGASALVRGTEDSSPMSFQQSVAPPQSLRGSEGDTSKVLQELERVRHGIQATLAAAVASGRMNSSTSTPPVSKVTAPAAPQSSLPAPQMPAPSSTLADDLSASQASVTREGTAVSKFSFEEL